MQWFKKLVGLDKLEAQINNLSIQLTNVEDENSTFKDKINELEKSEKDIATANGEAWVSVVDTVIGEDDKPGSGYFELDWNKKFVDNLIVAGYSGRSDEDIVDMWFNDLCRGVIQDNME